jgi:NADPH-dependent glutamate synthase beta subunit-like oxidoreductase
VSVLRSMEGEVPPLLGRRVAVYGGGNTAVDVARTARRLGATEAVIVYRRTRGQMPAHEAEVQEALDEGVQVKWLSTIAQAVGDTLTLEKMALDADGRPQPTGEYETLAADSLVLALGQDVDLGLLDGVPGLERRDGVVQVDPATLMTGRPGLFAGGDMVPSMRPETSAAPMSPPEGVGSSGRAGPTQERNVTVAVGHGKKAARHIDAWLRGTTVSNRPKAAPASFERLNPWYYSDAPATLRPQLDAARRSSSFDEVQGGLTEDNALFEARRCLSCGNCFECDNCYGVCPDNAVVKLGPGQGFQINLDYCKGCGVCAAECPCGAIDMVPEET